ncbi:helix-turn-helix transcriptional regulator [Oscillospiraceae bacterium 44-5]
MAFYDIFERLCDEKGVTPTQVARDNGLTQQTVSHWKTRGSTPKADTVQKLADYFEVSVDYLLKQSNPFAKGSEEFRLYVQRTLANRTKTAPDLLPSEFNEFERFIETLGYYTRLDGDNYRLHKGKASVVITLGQLMSLVRASKVTVAALVQDLMETATPPPEGTEETQEGE